MKVRDEGKKRMINLQGGLARRCVKKWAKFNHGPGKRNRNAKESERVGERESYKEKEKKKKKKKKSKGMN